MKGFGFLWVLIGLPFLMMAVSFCLPLLTKIKSETLPLHIVAWSWQGKAKWCYRAVDLDADGQDEIVFYDNGWWWAEWDGKQSTFHALRIPIPAQAEQFGTNHSPKLPSCIPSNMPSNILVAFPDPYVLLTPVPAPPPPPAPPMGSAPAAPFAPPATAAPPALSALPAPTSAPNTPRLMDIWLVTRVKEQWKVVSRKITVSQQIPSLIIPVFVGDWDKDGRANDVLFAVNDHVVEWWQRDEEGAIRLHARIKLPARILPELPRVPSPRTEGVSKGELWASVDMDVDGKFEKVDIDGDGKIDEVTIKMQVQNPTGLVVSTALSITLSSGHKFSLKLPHQISFAVKDFDGDGQTEIFGWKTLSTPERRFYCWDFDFKSHRLVTVLREKVSHTNDLTFRNIMNHLAFIRKLVFVRSKGGFQWLLVPALKDGRKVIARWRIEGGKWHQMDDIPLPNQNEFELLWVGDALLAFEKRYIGIASLVLISIENWLRYLILEFFDLDKHHEIFSSTNLWVWKEREGWRLLDRLTGYVTDSCSDCRSGRFHVVPYWDMLGDLDGDGKEEILVWEPKSQWIGQWKDGRWRKSRPIEGFAEPISIVRDGKRRWLLCFDPPNRFIAVRIDE